MACLILIKFQPVHLRACSISEVRASKLRSVHVSCSVMGLIPTWSSEFSLSFLVLDFAFFHEICTIVGPHSHCISMDQHWDNTK